MRPHLAKGARANRWVLAFGALVAALAACEDDAPKPSEAAPQEQPPAEQKPVVDQKIASAMAAAEANAQTKGSLAEGQPAPPRDGIIGVEAAARELPEGSPAQIVFGGAGSEPRLRLGPTAIAPGAQGASTLQLSYRPRGNVTPNIDFDLRFKTSAVDAVAGAAPGGLLATRFTFAAVRPAASQPGRLPENAKAEIAKLERSWVEFTTTPRGAVSARQLKVEGGDAGLEPFVTGAAEALSSVLLAYPEEPVGNGGFWMVKSRDTSDGTPVLTYRMVKVTGVTGDVAQLEVATRRYLLEPRLPMEGLPPHRVRQFQGEGEATLSIRAGAAYPDSATVKQQFVALLSLQDRPNQAVPIQSELEAKFASGPEAAAPRAAR